MYCVPNLDKVKSAVVNVSDKAMNVFSDEYQEKIEEFRFFFLSSSVYIFV